MQGVAAATFATDCEHAGPWRSPIRSRWVLVCGAHSCGGQDYISAARPSTQARWLGGDREPSPEAEKQRARAIARPQLLAYNRPRVEPAAVVRAGSCTKWSLGSSDAPRREPMLGRPRPTGPEMRCEGKGREA